MDSYGKELILDLKDCDPQLFTRNSIRLFLSDLCEEIGMEACDLHFWDDLDTPEGEKETEPHLVGTSAIQFIKTSNITIHTLDILKTVYLNVFSCKDFDDDVAAKFAEEWFNGELAGQVTLIRGQM